MSKPYGNYQERVKKRGQITCSVGTIAFSVVVLEEDLLLRSSSSCMSSASLLTLVPSESIPKTEVALCSALGTSSVSSS